MGMAFKIFHQNCYLSIPFSMKFPHLHKCVPACVFVCNLTCLHVSGSACKVYKFPNMQGGLR